MRDRLSYKELKTKTMLDNIEAKWYQVFDEKVARELIKLHKYMYFVEKVQHYRTKKLTKCWCFEFDKNIFNDVKLIKNKLYKKEVDKRD
ncbi:MAG: hypothetical protein E7E64_12945 [Clostridium celatum]|nr:hypothetical protein [Clostridium celatum]MDU4979846.1 hypothetical protein [Clostridium celatum]